MDLAENEKNCLPREVIEQIRDDLGVDENGLDVEMSQSERRRIENYRGKLNRSLRLLAVELYKEESHFVMELVQNAEDNQYSPSVEPSISFHLANDSLTVTNNEIGFTEDNVRKVCDVANSSKKKTDGYIGEKGIGFKSVFMVSDTPQIHSNGYHFGFDRSDPENLMGYVLPHWIEQIKGHDPEQTTIVLPARKDRPFSVGTLKDLHENLLLFLNKLRKLTVHSGQERRTYTRTDDGAITRLNSVVHSNTADTQLNEKRYVRFSKTVSAEGLNEDKRKDVPTIGLVLAFPVDRECVASPTAKALAYAFLPIRSSGFRFCIQADFLLTAAREDILQDREWNLRIRENIPAAFVEAIETFKEIPQLANSYFEYLPKKDDRLDDFFEPVASALFEKLKHTACIPDALGEWRKPNEIVNAPEDFKGLFSQADLELLLGGYYRHHDFKLDDTLAKELGCRSLTHADLQDLFKKNHQWISGKDVDWKARFYAYLASRKNQENLTKLLSSVPCIPIDKGELVNPSNRQAFHPLSEKSSYGFEHNLTILDSKIFKKAVKIFEGVDEFFSALGVKHAKPYELVTAEILKWHTNETLPTAKTDALIGHVRYIKDNFGEYIEGAKNQGEREYQAINRLKTGLMLATKQHEENWTFGKANTLYLSKEYRPEFCIEALLKDEVEKVKFLSPAYLPDRENGDDPQMQAEEVSRWNFFFRQVGVFEAPRLEEEHDGNIRCGHEMNLLMGSSVASVRKDFLGCLDRNWPIYAQSLTYTRKVSGRYSVPTASRFSEELRSMVAPTKKKVAFRLDQCYLDTKEMREILGGRAPYLDAKISNQELIKATHIATEVDADACLQRLKQIQQSGDETRSTLETIYQRLRILHATSRQKIIDSFAEHKLIRVMVDPPIWKSPTEVCWKSSGNAFMDRLYPPLRGQYPDLSNFFLSIGVPQELPTSKWVAALSYISALEDLKERKDLALSIYKRASRDLSEKARSREDWKEPVWVIEFRDKKVFIEEGGNLVANGMALFANDDPDIAALFREARGVFLMAVPHAEVPRIQPLLEIANVKSISASIKEDVVECEDPVHRVQDSGKIREMLMCIARVVYRYGAARFDEALQSGRFSRLRELEVVEVSTLILNVTLGAMSARKVGDTFLTDTQLILRAGAPAPVSQIAMVICKLLEVSLDLADTISAILNCGGRVDAEDFLKFKKVPNLPPAEESQILNLSQEVSISEIEPATEPDAEFENSWGEFEGSPSELEPLDTKSSTQNEEDSPVPMHVPPTYASSNRPKLKPNGTLSHGAIVDQKSYGRNDPDEQPPGAGRPKGQHNEDRESSSGPRLDAGREIDESTDHGATANGHMRSAKKDRFPSTSKEDESEKPDEQSMDQPQSGDSGEGDGSESGDERQSGWPQQGGAHGEFPSKRKHRTSKNRNNSDGALRTYVVPKRDSQEREQRPEDLVRAAENNAVGKAAVEVFFATQGPRWKSLAEMDHNNPGFDVRAISHDGFEEVIEIKGRKEAWNLKGVNMTPTELSKSKDLNERHWLFVVEFATDPRRRRWYLFNNPFGRIKEFRFDSGWKDVAVAQSTDRPSPEVGRFVDIPGEGLAEIVAVAGGGKLLRMNLVFVKDKSEVNGRLYVPATMFVQ